MFFQLYVEYFFTPIQESNGSYKGVIKREAVYKCTNKDYLPEAEPRANDAYINRILASYDIKKIIRGFIKSSADYSCQ